MRHFGDVVVQIYLFIALISGAIGLTEGISFFFGWQQAWYTLFIGLFALIWFISTFFVISLFRKYRVEHVYYILPIFYICSYALLSLLAFLVTHFQLSFGFIPTFFVSVSLASSGIELFIAGGLLSKISQLKKHVKTGKQKLDV
ncbi:hypothetical protein HOA92_00140 [archaeon]|jgi:hypothetical protein|nr:hypothetical protein [archaeon]MBT6761429.1 hypothetical protein [archaeon]